MGGQVGVDSRLDEGSTFWFEVSLKEAEQVDLVVEARPQLPVALSARILLAEDDAVNQMVVEEMLKTLGCVVVVDVVDDDEAACAAASATRYDLPFMDCHMPVMDGFEATRRIRDEGRNRGVHVPIVALTADALVGDRERCLASGMDDYMTEPVSTAQLAVAVQRGVETRQ